MLHYLLLSTYRSDIKKNLILVAQHSKPSSKNIPIKRFLYQARFQCKGMDSAIVAVAVDVGDGCGDAVAVVTVAHSI